MSFSSLQDFYSEVFVEGKNCTFTNRFVHNGTGISGYWYDGSLNQIVPAANRWGDLVQNGLFTGSFANWTLGTGWTWSTSGYVAHAVGSTSSITQTLPQLVTGRTYTTIYTVSSVGGSGNIVLSLGGTAGTARTANGTYTENLVCGATTTLDINVNTARSCRIDTVSVIENLSFLPYSDLYQSGSALWHGGDVTPDEKFLLGATAGTNATTWNPSLWLLVDILGVYPNIDLNSGVQQNLSNATGLSRYTDGVGVKAFLVETVPPGAVAYTFQISYTNQAGTAGRTMPYQPVGINSPTVGGYIIHGRQSSTVGTYGPFLPLADGDYGLRSIENITLSAASGAGTGHLVLCRPLHCIPTLRNWQMTEQDLVFQKTAVKRIYDGAYLSWLYFGNGNIVASSIAATSVMTGWG